MLDSLWKETLTRFADRPAVIGVNGVLTFRDLAE
ncbi:MAG: hypothetical protein JWO82_615, partial [Akkermansiaceae bacterium]|nr:hypothetical protein [Akkermansiaceae bacterium]